MALSLQDPGLGGVVPDALDRVYFSYRQTESHVVLVRHFTEKRTFNGWSTRLGLPVNLARLTISPTVHQTDLSGYLTIQRRSLRAAFPDTLGFGVTKVLSRLFVPSCIPTLRYYYDLTLCCHSKSPSLTFHFVNILQPSRRSSRYLSTST